MSKKRTVARYATLIAVVSAPLILALFINWGGGGIEPTVESLSLMLLASAFVFPLLFSILGNEKRDPGEGYAIAVGLPLGFSLVLATLSLAFGWDSYFSAALAVPFLALGVVLVAMAANSTYKYINGKRARGKSSKRGGGVRG